MTNFNPDPSFDDFSYEGPSVHAVTAPQGMHKGHPAHRGRLFRSAKQSGNKRRLMVIFLNSGGKSTSLPSLITPLQTEFHFLLDDVGYDLLFFSTAVCRSSPPGQPTVSANTYPAIGTSSTVWNPNANSYGPFYPGCGWIVPPGIVPPFYNGVGVPFADPARFNAIQSGIMATQWVAGAAAAMGVDPGLIDINGRSGSGWIAMMMFVAKNWAPLAFPGGTGQDARSTRDVYRRIYQRSGPSAWNSYQKLAAGTDVGPFPFFPKLETAPGGPSAGYDKPCINLQDTEASWLNMLSPLVLAQEEDVLAANLKKKYWFAYGDPDNLGAPWDITHVGTTTTGMKFAHCCWQLPTWENLLGSALTAVLSAADGTLGPVDVVIEDLGLQLSSIKSFLLAPDDVPAVHPAPPAFTPLQAAAKAGTMLVELRLILDPVAPVEPDGLKVYRYADQDVDLWSGGALFIPTPETEVRLPAAAGSVGEEAATIVLREDELTLRLASGEPQPRVECIVREVVELPSGPLPRTILVHVIGEVASATRNPGGRRGLVELQIATTKGSCDAATGIPATPECGWALGDQNCGVDLGPLRQDGIVQSAIGSTVTVAGLTLPEGFERYWHRGSLARLGVNLVVRFWDPLFPDVFALQRPPPKEWLGATVVATPGCRKLVEACREYENEENGGFFGFGIPDYLPTADKPE